MSVCTSQRANNLAGLIRKAIRRNTAWIVFLSWVISENFTYCFNFSDCSRRRCLKQRKEQNILSI